MKINGIEYIDEFINKKQEEYIVTDMVEEDIDREEAQFYWKGNALYFSLYLITILNLFGLVNLAIVTYLLLL